MIIFPFDASDLLPFAMIGFVPAVGFFFRHRALRRLAQSKENMTIDGWIHSHSSDRADWEEAHKNAAKALRREAGGLFLFVALMVALAAAFKWLF
jgi:hypothetical protein